MLNKVILMGRLTKDPELRYTPNNIPVCSYTIAVDRNYARQGEQKQTDFIPVVSWRSNAEFVSKYFSKGKMIIVVGSLQVRTWDDQEGKRHYITEVIAEETYFGESKRDAEGRTNIALNDDHSHDIEGFTPIEVDDELPF